MSDYIIHIWPLLFIVTMLPTNVHARDLETMFFLENSEILRVKLLVFFKNAKNILDAPKIVSALNWKLNRSDSSAAATWGWNNLNRISRSKNNKNAALRNQTWEVRFLK